MSKYKGKIIAGIIIAAVLAAAYFIGGGNSAADNKNTAHNDAYISEKNEESEKTGANNETANGKGKTEKSLKDEPHAADAGAKTENPNNATSEGGKSQTGNKAENTQNAAPKNENTEKNAPSQNGNGKESEKTLRCTLSVRCDTILKNADKLNADKKGIIPKDGVIFKEKKVEFFEGESVFNVLLREMKKNKIHLEFVNTPIYNSAYIEGIANIYEFDCGAQSGWMYRVNGVYPNCGSSRYYLKDGDRVEWIYTTSLGRDIGAEGVGGQKDE